MAARSVIITLVGLDTESRENVVETSRAAFPAAQIVTVETVEQAILQDEEVDLEILVLGGLTSNGAAAAAGVTDRAGLPRWAVVVLRSDGLEQGVCALVNSFRSAAARHELARENARLRGDLLSLSRRFVHDLRTTGGCILTTSEVVKEVLTADAPASAPLLQPVLDSAEELVRLVNRVNLVLRATANPNMREPVNVGSAYTVARHRLERRILESGVQIAEPQSWPDALGVSPWLEEVWRNLLANALQHGCRDRSPKIETGWSRQKGGYRFWVRDYGDGIPPGRLATIFHPFHLLHRPDAPSALGLSIVHRLIDLQGGRVGYEPQEDGSRFFFTLQAPAGDCLGVSPETAD